MCTIPGINSKQLAIFLFSLIALVIITNHFASTKLTNTVSFNVEVLTTTKTSLHVTQKRVLVLYAYLEKKSRYEYAKALKYFIDLGVEESDKIDYLFIIQGGIVSVNIPKFSNVKIFKRPNNW
jgi:hypothetical protein